jgi:hypothetical protein
MSCAVQKGSCLVLGKQPHLLKLEQRA